MPNRIEAHLRTAYLISVSAWTVYTRFHRDLERIPYTGEIREARALNLCVHTETPVSVPHLTRLRLCFTCLLYLHILYSLTSFYHAPRLRYLLTYLSFLRRQDIVYTSALFQLQLSYCPPPLTSIPVSIYTFLRTLGSSSIHSFHLRGGCRYSFH